MKLLSKNSEGTRYDVVCQLGNKVLGTVYKDGDVWRIEGDPPDGMTFADAHAASTEVQMREL